MRHRIATFVFLISVHCHALAQDGDALNLTHLAVPPPPEFLRQLLSPEAPIRLQALKLVGVSSLFFTQKGLNGEDWTKASQARLLFGRHTQDQDLAVVALQLDKFAWASILLHRPSGWERIGVFDCWCKYESDPLDGFVEFRSVLGGPETQIVFHESGGGSGLYDREISIVRVRGNRLETIFKTVDKRRDCHPTENKDYCTLTDTRLQFKELDGAPALMLARLESVEFVPRLDGLMNGGLPVLESYRNVHRVGCEVLLWDAAKRSFVRSPHWTDQYCP